ncbi:unnamed protein product, partial [Brachionus calyciflorus]
MPKLKEEYFSYSNPYRFPKNPYDMKFRMLGVNTVARNNICVQRACGKTSFAFVFILMNTLPTKAALADEPPRKIINNEANFNYTEDILAKLSSYEADRLVINREKQKSRPNYPLEPKSLNEILIPEWLQFNKCNEKCQIDTGGPLSVIKSHYKPLNVLLLKEALNTM